MQEASIFHYIHLTSLFLMKHQSQCLTVGWDQLVGQDPIVDVS